MVNLLTKSGQAGSGFTFQEEILPVFPPEIVQHIFSFVTFPKSLKNLSLSSRAICQLLKLDLKNVQANVLACEKHFSPLGIALPLEKSLWAAREDSAVIIRYFSNLLTLGEVTADELKSKIYKLSSDDMSIFLKNIPVPSSKMICGLVDNLVSRNNKLALEIIRNNLSLFIDLSFTPYRDERDNGYSQLRKKLLEQSQGCNDTVIEIEEAPSQDINEIVSEIAKIDKIIRQKNLKNKMLVAAIVAAIIFFLIIGTTLQLKDEFPVLMVVLDSLILVSSVLWFRLFRCCGLG